MKKYIVTLANMPQNQIACINNHIAVGSLFEVGESITDNTLHSGKNIVDDKRVIDTLVYGTSNIIKSGMIVYQS